MKKIISKYQDWSVLFFYPAGNPTHLTERYFFPAVEAADRFARAHGTSRRQARVLDRTGKLKTAYPPLVRTRRTV